MIKRIISNFHTLDIMRFFIILILFENLFKPRQLRLAVDMVNDFVSSIHNLKTVF